MKDAIQFELYESKDVMRSASVFEGHYFLPAFFGAGPRCVFRFSRRFTSASERIMERPIVWIGTISSSLISCWTRLTDVPSLAAIAVVVAIQFVTFVFSFDSDEFDREVKVVNRQARLASAKRDPSIVYNGNRQSSAVSEFCKRLTENVLRGTDFVRAACVDQRQSNLELAFEAEYLNFLRGNCGGHYLCLLYGFEQRDSTLQTKYLSRYFFV